ncbi:hypothetical protein [Streptomyces montanisoli]|uniref:Uncharacterized protein n=1 Tax=Streptomyces montanisoli TaxID=2798581 RepID=A0A940MIA6_9ACTN|nr:hypothetical protein [Streptomyces montanisoli]MBP0459078.1 hypothetical protein [Streptomyces montanisoli]
MADTNLNAAPRAYAHPQASPGYGKQDASGQGPRRTRDFDGLPVREAYLAAFIDALPEGSAIDVKSLARAQPLYGQQAVGSALRALSGAGFLHRFRENVGVGGRMRWVWRTYFSRTARDGAWWARFLAGDAVQDDPERRQERPAPDPEPKPEPEPERQPGNAPAPRSEAYDVLATLGRVDHRLVLSARECTALEPDAAQWLARGVDRAGIVQALTSGLPQTVMSPGGLVRCRLRDKLPPEPVAIGAPAQAGTRHMTCTKCGAPGGPVSLVDGVCRACRTLPPEDVHRYVQLLRAPLTAAGVPG